MAFVGMDVEAVERLGRTLQDKGGVIEEIVSTITSQLQSVDWKGPDADRFRDDWNNTICKQLRDAAEKLKGVGQSALNNAKEQREVAQR